MNWDEKRRLVAVCTDCDSACAAVELAGGEIKPIGSGECRSCGQTEFTPVTAVDVSSRSDSARGD